MSYSTDAGNREHCEDAEVAEAAVVVVLMRNEVSSLLLRVPKHLRTEPEKPGAPNVILQRSPLVDLNRLRHSETLDLADSAYSRQSEKWQSNVSMPKARLRTRLFAVSFRTYSCNGILSMRMTRDGVL